MRIDHLAHEKRLRKLRNRWLGFPTLTWTNISNGFTKLIEPASIEELRDYEIICSNLTRRVYKSIADIYAEDRFLT